MAFPLMIQRLQPIADAGLKFFKNQFGGNGLRLGEEIDQSISWRPTFHVRYTRTLIVAAEVDEVLYPASLKIAAHGIMHYDFPVSAYLICPLEVFQSDPRQAQVNQLKKHGFGIITVDDTGLAVRQNACIPLAQHISDEELENHIRPLTSKLKVGFRSAHITFRVDAGQGLQKAGQMIEALVDNITEAAVRSGMTVSGRDAADKIDSLYGLKDFAHHRAALGGAREFMKKYRNVASHPSKTPRQAVEKLRGCRSGFLDAIAMARNLTDVAKAKHFRLNIVTV
jgi:hypothetical protein